MEALKPRILLSADNVFQGVAESWTAGDGSDVCFNFGAGRA